MSKNNLFNRKNNTQLKAEREKENFKRITCSFYRYIKISDPKSLRNILYKEFSNINILGRVYIANEGINAQIDVPISNWDYFIKILNSHSQFSDMFIKKAVMESDYSFLKLIIKIKHKIVADGLNENSYDLSNIGTRLNAIEFNKAMEDPDSVLVDIRNYYESEVGHFEGAICPDVETFKESLPIIKKQLEKNKNKKILLYCTGGIRCEKASAYLKHHNFKDVNQLEGGIIEYSHQVKKEKLKSKFKGKNFVFDFRMNESITEEIISNCHQCDQPSDSHTNCNNQACHILFIQCFKCNVKFNGCCSMDCKNIDSMSIEDQKKIRKNPKKAAPLKQFQKGIKPKLKDLLDEQKKNLFRNVKK